MEEAKEIFNAGIRKLRIGLDYYSIEKYPIMHCNLILEITELYRYAVAATDPDFNCITYELIVSQVQALSRIF